MNIHNCDGRLVFVTVGADFIGTDFKGANLRGADLRGANLKCTDFTEVDLRGACLIEANLRGANLEKADLGGADLRGADLRGAILTGADLRETDLRRAIGNGKEIKNGPWRKYETVFYKDVIAIGCERHTREEWKAFKDEEIAVMGKLETGALEWWKRNKWGVLEFSRKVGEAS